MDRVREDGLHSVGRVTRLVLVASLALTAAFSALAEFAFPGRSSASPGASSTATAGRAASSGDVRVALPPRGGGEGLAPPPALPVQPVQPVAPVATSGGS
jgi:hypothetical protein